MVLSNSAMDVSIFSDVCCLGIIKKISNIVSTKGKLWELTLIVYLNTHGNRLGQLIVFCPISLHYLLPCRTCIVNIERIWLISEEYDLSYVFLYSWNLKQHLLEFNNTFNKRMSDVRTYVFSMVSFNAETGDVFSPDLKPININ